MVRSSAASVVAAAVDHVEHVPRLLDLVPVFDQEVEKLGPVLVFGILAVDEEVPLERTLEVGGERQTRLRPGLYRALEDVPKIVQEFRARLRDRLHEGKLSGRVPRVREVVEEPRGQEGQPRVVPRRPLETKKVPQIVRPLQPPDEHVHRHPLVQGRARDPAPARESRLPASLVPLDPLQRRVERVLVQTPHRRGRLRRAVPGRRVHHPERDEHPVHLVDEKALLRREGEPREVPAPLGAVPGRRLREPRLRVPGAIEIGDVRVPLGEVPSGAETREHRRLRVLVGDARRTRAAEKRRRRRRGVFGRAAAAAADEGIITAALPPESSRLLLLPALQEYRGEVRGEHVFGRARGYISVGRRGGLFPRSVTARFFFFFFFFVVVVVVVHDVDVEIVGDAEVARGDLGVPDRDQPEPRVGLFALQGVTARRAVAGVVVLEPPPRRVPPSLPPLERVERELERGLRPGDDEAHAPLGPLVRRGRLLVRRHQRSDRPRRPLAEVLECLLVRHRRPKRFPRGEDGFNEPNVR